ncbi:PAC2 family protein [Arthrobacter sp. zg-Y1219]|uniref:PAC2 family protein n=1 Tax=Arthrobacter sp. zg-Y1219 TaxID=3049067 RepID=UPI0024C2A60C|nr:PAC2 family protein [Arthrobacter sp. zg-Y1219]MDK1360971.1 PAC2 family protein [Arthrobacter sp. zg-Y1219]
MLDPLTLFNLNPEVADDAGLHGLQLLVGFTGFAEAGHVVSQIRDELLETLDHDLVASFDTDQLIDYRARRPQISFVEDHLADYEPPLLNLYRLYDGLGEPFLFLTGFEPDVQWERFTAAVVHLAKTFGVQQVSWIHSIPMPVPHTRPVGVTVHGNRPDLMAGISSWRPNAQIQAAVGHILELRLTQAGIDVVGHAMHVPHYLAEAEFPPAAVAGLEYLGAAASLVLPTDRLREAGRDVERQIAEQVEASAEVKGVVATLEKRYDEYTDSSVRRSLLVKDNDELANAEELGAAVEAYLASPQAEEESEALWPENHENSTEDAETGGKKNTSGQPDRGSGPAPQDHPRE